MKKTYITPDMFPAVSELEEIHEDENGTFYWKKEKLGKNISYYYEDENHAHLCGSFNENFSGNFSWPCGGGRNGFGILLNEWTTYDMVLNATCEIDERILRYSNEIVDSGGLRPLIKINIRKGLIYFLRPECGQDGEFEDKVLFEKKGIKARHLNFVWF